MGIVNDVIAEKFVIEYRPPSISDLFKKITKLVDDSKSSVIYELNVSNNSIDACTILKYCLDNEYGYFSREDFNILNLSRTLIFENDMEKCITLISELLNKYKNLTIYLLDTNLTYAGICGLFKFKRCLYNDIDLDRLKLSYKDDVFY